MASVYDVITARIVEQLEQGVIPWQKPWANGEPMNLLSQKAYRGINSFLLLCSPFRSPYWLTFNQAQTLGGNVRKGEKGSPVIFWKFPTKAEQEEVRLEGREVHPVVRYYTVFNVEQCDQLPVSDAPALTTTARISAAEEIVSRMQNRPAIVDSGAAFYNPKTDTVGIPEPTQFIDNAEYYSTLFHELTHATGHSSRLNRSAISTETIHFGSTSYAKEELVAEMGAAMLCGVAGIENRTIARSASYIHGWLKRFQDDRRLVVFAAAQAQRAADYVRGKTEE